MSASIVHLATDEKFIDAALRDFERVGPGLNKLVILGQSRPLRHVRHPVYRFCPPAGIGRFAAETGARAIILHSLPSRLSRHVCEIQRPTRVYWLGWGYDYYQRLLSSYYPDGFVLPDSRSFGERWLTRVGWVPATAALARQMGRGPGGLSARIRRGLQRLDGFAPILDVEYEMVRARNPWFQAPYFAWSYGTVEDDYAHPDSAAFNSGPDILVGNNAAEENNHVSVLRCLAQQADLSGRRVIVPLSYAGARSARRVAAAGKQLLGDRFVPLMDFLPAAEYRRIVQGCGHVVMNHVRQQGLGNVCIAMLAGARVYLNPANPLYGWMARQGASIDSFEGVRASASGPFVFEPLTREQQARNAGIIWKNWSRDRKREQARLLLSAAMHGVGGY